MSSSEDAPLESRDIAVLRSLAGASFGPEASLTLPSGRKLSPEEAQALTSAYADPAPGLDDPERVQPALADEDAPAWAKLDTRHRLQIGSWEEREEERAPWTYSGGVVLLFALLLAGVILALLYVVTNWPTSNY